jgi:hypothetical protein
VAPVVAQRPVDDAPAQVGAGPLDAAPPFVDLDERVVGGPSAMAVDRVIRKATRTALSLDRKQRGHDHHSGLTWR